MANIYEVAKLAGVSLATVSRVINPGAKVSDKTRQKVLAAMKQLGYRPNSIAQSLATRSSNTVGVLVSELHGPFFGAMVSAIEETLRAAGKFVLVAASHSKEELEAEAIKFLVSRNCDALIAHIEALPDKFIVEQNKKSAPLVVLNRKVRGLADRCFSLNNELGGYLAAQSLLKLGHRNIAYISGPLDFVDAQQRLLGHKRALTEAGVTFDERLLHEGDYHETGGSDALNDLFNQGVKFSAVICANDDMAAGAMAAAHDRGLRLPEELSIVGFDDSPIARYVYPKLSTVHYPIADMSRMAARWVLRNVYQQNSLEVQQAFEPRYIARDSVSRPA
ncbi:MAG TPA: LacI family DNA-binding transcriptional regulator [Povalibacter sp.]|uniref:LacI family DNA-binding transcriptional regulator n=1 Tax=Povalibacter sp. TaxID=1962978 RepID=UPI002B6897FC|nr:LacI family DNA-binding transcriptional regulator [Povalibacter sp.]HMN44352.1 LacI family DNA-binding transcriptional regulator [Povalibacter sp.]